MKKAYICPGPDKETKCKSSERGTPRGGRCRECRLEAMRRWQRKYNRNTNAKPKARTASPAPRHGRWASAFAKQKADEVAQARAVAPDRGSFKGALEVVMMMQRVAA